MALSSGGTIRHIPGLGWDSGKALYALERESRKGELHFRVLRCLSFQWARNTHRWNSKTGQNLSLHWTFQKMEHKTEGG